MPISDLCICMHAYMLNSNRYVNPRPVYMYVCVHMCMYVWMYEYIPFIAKFVNLASPSVTTTSTLPSSSAPTNPATHYNSDRDRILQYIHCFVWVGPRQPTLHHTTTQTPLTNINSNIDKFITQILTEYCST